MNFSRASDPRSTAFPRPEVRLAIGTRPPLLRELLCNALAARGFEICGAADNEEDLGEVLDRESPAVLLFDYEAIGPGGESVVHRLRRDHPSTRILVLATRSGPGTVEAVLCAGASGLVGKDEPFETLARALLAVAAGEVWANRLATAQALGRLTSPELDRPGHAGDLTRREAEIVSDVRRGLRNKEIARRLGISEKTVKSHLNNIFRKLGIESRMALATHGAEEAQPRT